MASGYESLLSKKQSHFEVMKFAVRPARHSGILVPEEWRVLA